MILNCRMVFNDQSLEIYKHVWDTCKYYALQQIVGVSDIIIVGLH